MKQTVGAKVLFTRENAKKCICRECPVQANSQCIKENSEKMGEAMTTKFFQPEIVPGLYCSSGTASCQDIDTNRGCICGACDIYNGHRIGSERPLDHFCKNGKAR